ncbi:hypothetical protein L840_3912 [Mycobacterium sp. MAC_011194_8550]|nr:hypothetical protein L840_3912 [Mycobacterium sp. MAC_011194_8550]
MHLHQAFQPTGMAPSAATPVLRLRRAGRDGAGKGPTHDPPCRRARITLLQPTRNAKSNYEFYKNGYRIDVEPMRGHVRIATRRAPGRAKR